MRTTKNLYQKVNDFVNTQLKTGRVVSLRVNYFSSYLATVTIITTNKHTAVIDIKV